ncbi:hypothetical protein ES702_07268 [subsurface metagenome]
MVVNKNRHPLHKVIGDMIQESDFPNCTVIKDPACGGNQNIPLFCSLVKSNQTEYCNVDLLILKDNEIRVIVEIEEANITPTKIFGKFLTSALSSYYIHRTQNDVPIGMGNWVSFIQILDMSKLEVDKTAKFNQWEYIENSIQSIVPIKNSKIGDYKIFFGDISNFGEEDKRQEVIQYIRGVLK